MNRAIYNYINFVMSDFHVMKDKYGFCLHEKTTFICVLKFDARKVIFPYRYGRLRLDEEIQKFLGNNLNVYSFLNSSPTTTDFIYEWAFEFYFTLK